MMISHPMSRVYFSHTRSNIVSFDPINALCNHPEIKLALEEYDGLIRHRATLVTQLEQTEAQINGFQADFTSRFVVSVKPKAKSKKTPAAKKEQSLGQEIVSALEEAVAEPAKPTKPAEKPARKLSYGQWMASVRQALKHGAPLYAETAQNQDEPWWKKQFEAGKKPSEAATGWANRKHLEAKPANSAKPVHQLSEPWTDGVFTTPAKLGITEHDLNLAISLELRPDEGERARIGIPLNTNKGLYAVVLVNQRSTHSVYHLHPVGPADGERRIEWTDRRKQYPQLAPEDVPLSGVFVEDEKGHEYLLGPDESRIFCEVSKAKPAKTK